MAARTLIKIGKPATNHLIQVLDKNPDIFIKQQAIDALGGIAAKNGDYRALNVIIEYFHAYVGANKIIDKLTIWKLIRSLSAFKESQEAAKHLLKVLNRFSDPPLIWEAARSLGQIGVTSPEINESLVKLEENENEEIRKAAKIALMALYHNYNENNLKL
jgi:HEAT repeat protein